MPKSSLPTSRRLLRPLNNRPGRQFHSWITRFGFSRAPDNGGDILGQLHKFILAARDGRTPFQTWPEVAAVGLQYSRFHIIRQNNVQQFAPDSLAQVPVIDWKHYLNPAKKVARHPVGASDKN